MNGRDLSQLRANITQTDFAKAEAIVDKLSLEIGQHALKKYRELRVFGLSEHSARVSAICHVARGWHQERRWVEAALDRELEESKKAGVLITAGVL